MKTSDFKELIVWQKAMDIVVATYALTQKLPKSENYALSNQMRRAAVSVPSNIAEGQSRNSEKEFVQFLTFARGSLSELETQLHICVRVNMLLESDIAEVLTNIREVGKMLRTLITKLSNN
ncbi:MAG: four helix bundle protein [Alistipes sp.]|nr:four helix bundle protein [Alistipes sp.]MBQ8775068.1 four helix bundle protein [Alistipes sp.]